MAHQGDKPFKCPYCAYGTIQKAHLKRHLEAIHSTSYEESFGIVPSAGVGSLDSEMLSIDKKFESCEEAQAAAAVSSDGAASDDKNFPA